MKHIASLLTLVSLISTSALAERSYTYFGFPNTDLGGSANVTYQPVDTVATPQGHAVTTGYQDNLQKDVWITECYDALTATRWWSKTLSSATGEARPACIATDRFGNVYVGGFIDVSGQGADFCLVKYAAADGQELWRRTYNNSAKDGEDKIVAITVDYDDIYVTGYSMGTSSEDYYTLKYNTSGTVLWGGQGRRYATSYQDRPADICVSSGMGFSGLAVTGKSRIAGTTCFTTVVYDHGDGSEIRTLHYDTAENDEATSVSFGQSGMYVTGLVKIPSSTNYAVHTLRYVSGASTHQWVRTFTGPGGNEGTIDFRPKVAVVGEDDVFMACSSKLDGFKTVCAITYYSANGNMVFSKTNLPSSVPQGTFITDTVRDLALDRMGNAILVGNCNSTVTGQDSLAVKFSRHDGSVMWEKRMNGSATAGIETGIAVAVTPDNNVIVASQMDRGDQNSYYNMITTRINTLALSKGDLVYGGGVKTGATVNSMGTPCILSDGAIVTKATVKSGSSTLNALICTRNGNEVVALQGQPVPGITGAKYSSFSDPVSGDTEAYSSVITMSGTASGLSTALLSTYTGSLKVALQTGTQVPGLPAGVLLSSITNVSPDWTAEYAMVTLKGTGITSANNVALIELTGTMNYTASYVARKGESITANGKTSTVSSISIFSPPVGATGHSRSNGWGRSSFILTLADARKVVMMDRSGTRYVNGVTGAASNVVAGANWKSFASPGVAQEADNTTARFIMNASLQTGVAGVTSANDSLLVVSDSGYNGYGVLAREGAAAPGTTAKYASLSAPISSFPGYAFKTTLSGTGVTTSNNQAIYTATAANNATLLVRTGMTDFGILGYGGSNLVFSSFSNIAWTGRDAGPMIRATLRGPGVTSANNQALYAFDSTGHMRRIFRTGDVWGTLKVKSFTMFNPVAKAMGSARSINSEGFVTMLVTFTNLSQSIVKIAIP
jgi:hypothetical protein